MRPIPHEKLDQAVSLLSRFDLDCWLLLGRETGELCDPSLHLILEPAVTWQSAFLITAGGERVAIVGRYDVHNIELAGGFTRVIGYDADIAVPLRAELARLQPQRIGLNFSRDNHTSDGLTLGLYLSLLDWLNGTPFRDRLVSADGFASHLRAVKSPGEVERVEGAIALAVELLGQVGGLLRRGMTEQELQRMMHDRLEQLGVGTAWDHPYCPVVNFGPDSAIGHAMPGPIPLAPGQVVHLDFGVKRHGYCSDLQRCWYLAQPGETEPPAEVRRAFDAVAGAIQAAAGYLRPGRTGADVDTVARRFLTEAGYPEFKHALGHQVGRTAHDGATLLGPRWPRYGSTVEQPVREGEVYTLELGAMTSRGIVSLEEMVVVTADGCRFLAAPQRELWMVTLS
ncbi:MAG: M24 family metallopeptidase [Bacillota bacterium]